MEHLNTIPAVTVDEKIDLFNRMHKLMMLIECKSNRRHDNALDQLLKIKK